MTFNELQKNYWQKDAASSKLTIDSDMLVREVKRNKEAFESSIFWRDFREVGVSIIMVGVFLYGAFKSGGLPAVGSLTVAAMCLFVAGFFIVDRRIQRKKKPNHTEPLSACIESSLTQVNHQIWLLKNIFWWYLLPFIIGLTVFFAATTWDLCKALPAGQVLAMLGIILFFVVLVFWGVYWLNQYAVRKGLIPRREELEAMLKNLTNGDNAIRS